MVDNMSAAFEEQSHLVQVSKIRNLNLLILTVLLLLMEARNTPHGWMKFNEFLS